MNQNIKITSDAVIFHKNEGEIKLLLIKRKNPPDQGRFAFPGGFVDDRELVIDACQRELEEETGKNVYTILQLRLHPTIIKLKKDIFNRGYSYSKVEIDHTFPKYIIENKEKLKDWILK